MKNIEFPEHWQAPKYKLGQYVKQGQIVGMEYNQPGTRRSIRFGEGWDYWILPNELEDYADTFDESDIEPLTTEELHSLINERQSAIEVQQKNIDALNEQAKG